MVLLCLHGCASFIEAESESGGESSSAASDADSAGSSAASTSGSTTLDSAGSSDPGSGSTTPDATNPDSGPGSGPDSATSSGRDSDVDSSGSTSDEPSTTGGVDPSSTGEVPLTCVDLVLPEAAPAACSSGGGDAVTLEVVNDCFSVAVLVLWVDYGCEEIPYGLVEPGELWEQGTYQNHPWRIRNAETGELMREVPPLGGDTSLAVLQR